MSRKWQVQLIVCCTVVTFLSVSRCFALVQDSVLTDVIQEALLPEKIISEFMNSLSNDDEDTGDCQKALLPFLLTKDRPEWTTRSKCVQFSDGEKMKFLI